MSNACLARAVEGLIFASEVPLAPEDIARRLGVGDLGDTLMTVAARHEGHGIELVERGGRWHFQTPADLAHLLRETRDVARRLSSAAIETLAIIAYQEPVSRGDRGAWDGDVRWRGL